RAHRRHDSCRTRPRRGRGFPRTARPSHHRRRHHVDAADAARDPDLLRHPVRLARRRRAPLRARQEEGTARRDAAGEAGVVRHVVHEPAARRESPAPRGWYLNNYYAGLIVSWFLTLFTPS